MKKKKSAPKTKKEPTIIDLLPKNEVEYINNLILLNKNLLNPNNEGLNAILNIQIDRLEKELANLQKVRKSA